MLNVLNLIVLMGYGHSKSVSTYAFGIPTNLFSVHGSIKVTQCQVGREECVRVVRGRRGKDTEGGKPEPIPRVDADQDPALTPSPPRAIVRHHRTPRRSRGKNKFRPPILGADVDGPRRFVPFVLEASGRLGTAAGAFLEYLRTLCHFAILRFRALVSVISVKYNARMALHPMGALPLSPNLGRRVC